MKIAITGHTRGIGKACADVFRHHTIYGYSRSNGYDIKDAEVVLEENQASKDNTALELTNKNVPEGVNVKLP